MSVVKHFFQLHRMTDHIFTAGISSFFSKIASFCYIPLLTEQQYKGMSYMNTLHLIHFLIPLCKSPSFNKLSLDTSCAYEFFTCLVILVTCKNICKNYKYCEGGGNIFLETICYSKKSRVIYSKLRFIPEGLGLIIKPQQKCAIIMRYQYSLVIVV